MKLFTFLLLQSLSYQIYADVCFQPNSDLAQIRSLASSIKSINNQISPPLLPIECELGDGSFDLQLDEKGNIASFNIENEFIGKTQLSVSSLNQGSSISLFNQASKPPFIIEKHKKESFDPIKGGKLNFKVLETRAPYTPLIGAITRSYRNYTIEIKKVDDKWKIFFDDEEIRAMKLYPRYSSWGWDEVFGGTHFVKKGELSLP